jgi:hypothetical protein
VIESNSAQSLIDVIGRLCNIVDRCLDRMERVVRKEETDFLCLLVRAFDQSRAKDAARAWVAEHLQPSSTPSSTRENVRALKHVCERQCAVGHLLHSDFLALLKEDGRFKIVGNSVYCIVT